MTPPLVPLHHLSMGSAYEKPITKNNLQKALASFERDESAVDRYGTLFVLLLDDGRFEEAALLLDEPGQVVSKALEVALEKLAREERADATVWPFFEAIVEKKPRLFRAPSEEQGPVGLNFRLFRSDKEELCLRAVRLLVDVYGIEGELQHGQTLLHRVAVSGLHSPIAFLVERGASPAAKDCLDETPFNKLADSLNTGIALETFELLKTPGARVKKDALGTKLASVTEHAPPLAEIVALVRLFLSLGAKVDAPDYDGRTPLAHALLVERPLSERRALADLLVSSGASYAQALPGVVTAHRPAQLRDALVLSGAKPGDTYGKKKQTLLHLAIEALEGEDVVVGKNGTGERAVPVLDALVEFGESLAAKDAKGLGPLELARKKRKELSPEEFACVEAALTRGGAPVTKAQSAADVAAALAAEKRLPLRMVFPDAAFALGVLGAIDDGGALRPAAIEKAARVARKKKGESAREERCVEALHDTEVSAAELATVKTLSFNVDESIYLTLAEAIDADLGGESEALCPRSIEGVQHLPKLEDLALDVYAAGARDLAPLAGHPCLRTLRLQHAPASPAPLLSLPRLERVVVDDPKKALGALVTSLEARGVACVSRTSHFAASPRIAANAPAPSKSVKPKRSAKKAAAKKTAAKKRA